MLFVLDRRTGIPLYPVIERPVPASDVRGEVASPTQPFSTLPLLAPQSLQPADAFGVVGWDRYQCRRKIEAARHDGAFTPPSLRGTLFAPTTGGGANWGGVSIDPHRNRLFANTSRAAEIIRLIPRASSGSSADTVPEGAAAQLGTPYAVTRQILLSPLGLPCRAPPWGVLAAIDLDTGARAWESPLGSTSTLAPFGIALPWGTPNLGGSIVTGGGLVFVGAAMDSRLRAFDEETGAELWAGDLPAGGQATPMTYAVAGRQYIVIAAGGHSVLGTARGDSLVAFALPQNNRS
jgi:quinoprotein glucose dehydrogenase